MLVHPQFDPIALQIGPLAVRWYGLMYLVAFGLLWAVGRWRIARTPNGVWTVKDLDDVLVYGILGTILGGRLGYVLFYKLADYAGEPWRIFYVWEGGMSFHGGMLGVIFALWLFARSRTGLDASHRFHRAMVPGLAAGRIGNFLMATWGTYGTARGDDFPNVTDSVSSHSTVRGWRALFAWFWVFDKPRPRGAVPFC